MNKISSTSNYKVWVLAMLAGSTMSISADTTKLRQMADEFRQTEATQKSQAIEFAKLNGLPIRKELNDGSIIELQKIENGIPLYYTTHNADAAITTRTDQMRNNVGVTGNGYNKLGEWDAGAVLATHDELIGRITQVDSPSSISDHSTHVAGTLIASGAETAAKGMAYEGSLKAYDWNSDSSEMTDAAANGMEVSNHSYGYITGWDGPGDWYGDTSISQNESYRFGFYSSSTQDWDDIAFNAPKYLIVKAAGNDRNDDAPALGTHHTHNGYGDYNDTHNDDGYDNGGFDTISDDAIGKNVLTVGAVDDIANYTDPSDVVMSTFSGWGPADDGRIKPDIVANGIGLYSSIGSGDSEYNWYSGTSMASPNAAGTLALLQQYYQSTHSGTPMRSATLKALVIHTADEAGSYTGPDYKFGWGLLNANKAADKITEDGSDNVIDELTLAENGSYTKTIELNSSADALKVTIAWTDPAGTPVSPALDPADKMIVNDLDLQITKGGTTYYPWTLDKDNPANAATQNKRNDTDNIEQVYIDSPSEGNYTVEVKHTGGLVNNEQNFSIILTYTGNSSSNSSPTAYAGSDLSTPVNQSITITGSGTDTDGTISSYRWTENGTEIATTASFDYTSAVEGDHTLILTVTDNEGATGSDSMVVTVTISDEGSGSGGGCTYNPHNKGIDLMVMIMIMMSLFYPLRRKFLK